ncbi:hypothetical protein P7K49_016704 [Saguinus oedipus]|uniref:Uncharacterized protein n=1 Tax=Saguinus oedipus TaxID=9490 RepID=A0ABQ9VDM0_SAGOE|nr:hypothetical protein P7K49_016704 [Saguinus oedipus]
MEMGHGMIEAEGIILKGDRKKASKDKEPLLGIPVPDKMARTESTGSTTKPGPEDAAER